MRRASLTLLVLVAGCKGLPDACAEYAGRSCISLAVQLAGDGPASIDAIQLVPLSGITFSEDKPVRQLPMGGATPLPLLVAVLPATLTGTQVAIDVRGLLAGEIVGEAGFAADLGPSEHASGTVALDRFFADMAQPDLLPPPDLRPVPCDPVSQTHCPSGQKCTLVASQPKCISQGSVATGQSCSDNPDNCAAGNFCYVHAPGIAACERFCATDSDCQSNISANPLSSYDVSYCHFTVGPVRGCTFPCNPLLSAVASSGCITGLKCDSYGLVRGDMGVVGDYTECDAPGSGGDGATCTQNTDCAAGYLCISTATANVSHCRPYCRKATNSDCPSNYTCGNITGATWIGVCCPAAGC